MLFFHNSYGTSEFPDCENRVGADCMGNLRWANMEPSMHFRKTNTDPSVHFRKANTDPSMHFRKANTEFFLPVLLPNPNFSSKFTPSFIPNITINLLHHDECNIISQVIRPSRREASTGEPVTLYVLCLSPKFEIRDIWLIQPCSRGRQSIQ